MDFIADTFYKNNSPDRFQLLKATFELTEEGKAALVPSQILQAEYTMEISEEDCKQDCKVIDDSWYHGKFDAQAWAHEFCKIAKALYNVEIDEGWMIGWMANAYEKGRSELYNNEHPYRPYQIGDLVELICPICEEGIELVPQGTVGEIVSYYNEDVDGFDCHLYIPTFEDGLAVSYGEIKLYAANVESSRVWSIGMPVVVFQLEDDNEEMQYYVHGHISSFDGPLDCTVAFKDMKTRPFLFRELAHNLYDSSVSDIVNTDTATIDEVIPF